MKHFILFHTLVSALLITDTLTADAQPKTCADLRSGDYYYYPRNTLQQYHVIISGDQQKVLNMTRRKGSSHYDSSVYRIEWKDACEYTLKYVEGDGLADDDLKFLTKHKLVYHIDSIASDYYLFSSYQDRSSKDRLLAKDTIWTHPQTHSADNILFGVTDPNRIRKIHFNDTSQMALLYIYRPGKLKLSMSDLMIFYNDLPMVVLKNKSAAVIALFKEAPFTLKSRVPAGTKVEGDLPMDIKFGKVYYVRADMIWGLYKTGNTRLEFSLVNPQEGKPDFDGIYSGN
jgi:hypothetical protein